MGGKRPAPTSPTDPYQNPPPAPANADVAAERERAALVCEAIANEFGESTADYCANAIRYGVERAARIKNGEDDE